MHRIARLTAVFLMVALFAGCTTGVCLFAPKAPGQAVASENNFENGVKQYNMGHYKQAIHQFEKAIEKDPTNFKAYYYLGLSHKGDGLIDSALKYLQKAIDLNPNDAGWVAKVRAQMNACHQEKEKHGKGTQDNQGHGKGKDK